MTREIVEIPNRPRDHWWLHIILLILLAATVWAFWPRDKVADPAPPDKTDTLFWGGGVDHPQERGVTCEGPMIDTINGGSRTYHYAWTPEGVPLGAKARQLLHPEIVCTIDSVCENGVRLSPHGWMISYEDLMVEWEYCIPIKIWHPCYTRRTE